MTAAKVLPVHRASTDTGEPAPEGVFTFEESVLVDAEQASWLGLDASTLPPASGLHDRFVAQGRQVWCELPIGEKWLAAFRITPDSRGEPAIGELRVFPRDRTRPQHRTQGTWKGSVLGARARCPRFGVNSQVVKGVRWGAVLAMVREVLPMIQTARASKVALQGFDLGASLAWADEFAVEPMPRRRKAPGRGRPRVHSDEAYAKVAALYLAAKARGGRAPAQDVARTLGLPSAAAVRVMVNRAKRIGLVTGGRVWTLTPRAHALLQAPVPRLPRIATDSETRGSKRPQPTVRRTKKARKSS